MKTIKLEGDKTGWVNIPGDTKTVVAYYIDGHCETYTIGEFLTLRDKKRIYKIDCLNIADKNPN